jgi:hypothetical protein
MMSLKPFHHSDDSALVGAGVVGYDAAGGDDGTSSFSSPSLLASDARSPGSNGGAFDGFSVGASSGSGSGSNSGSIIGGGLGSNSTLSALFSSSLSGPFLHDH